jgi:hypothetical protein
MQYYCSKILLHRPTASFGSKLSDMSLQRNASRQICIENAKNIANALQDYRLLYGDASTFSGVGLHMISTSATILIAAIVEERSSDLIFALQTCVTSLSEMERAYIVARRVRRVIRLIVGLCHIDIDSSNSTRNTERTYAPKHPINLLEGASESNDDPLAFQFLSDGSKITTVLEYGSLWMDDFQGIPEYTRYPQFDTAFN